MPGERDGGVEALLCIHCGEREMTRDLRREVYARETAGITWDRVPRGRPRKDRVG